MAKMTIGFGAFLIVLGLLSYFIWSNQESPTALIPAFAGALFLASGFVAHKSHGMRMHVMHFAVLLAAILILATARSLGKLPALFSGEPVPRPVAVKVQAVVALSSIVYLIFCIRSFIEARRRRPTT